MLRTSVLFLFLDLVAMTAALASPAPVRPLDLRTEYRTNPAGIDVTRPELGWRLSAADPKARGLRQSAWRILAASSVAGLAADKGELRDSGRTPGSESAHIAWRGRALGSGMQVFWKVQVWDQDGNPSAWSALARFSIGLLSAGDWKAHWIGRDEQAGYKHPGSVCQNIKGARWIWSSMGTGTAFFRSPFAVPAARQVVRAFCVAGADSSYELFLNGKQQPLRPHQSRAHVTAAGVGT